MLIRVFPHLGVSSPMQSSPMYTPTRIWHSNLVRNEEPWKHSSERCQVEIPVDFSGGSNEHQ